MKKVFIASRFGEFKEIREKLTKELSFCNMEAINLDDNMAIAQPPLHRSLNNIQQSDIIILLIGNTYGSIPKGENYSYTHLEYKEALKYNKPIYVFGIGKLYDNEEVVFSDEKNIKNWQEEILDNSIISKLGKSKTDNMIIHEIIASIYSETKKVWYDDQTGLMWQVKLNAHEELGRYQWNDIFLYKDNLNKNKYSGYEDWRIPTIDEIKTLITEESYSNSYGYDEETFIKKPLVYSMTMEFGRFWSKTSNKKNNNFAYGINFNRKRTNSKSKNGTKEKSKTRYVRCVRLWDNRQVEEIWNNIDKTKIDELEDFLYKFPNSKYEEDGRNILVNCNKKKEEHYKRLSLIEQKLLQRSEVDKNMPILTYLMQCIKNEEFDTEKLEVLLKIQDLMKKNNKWKESSTSKNTKKDKEYQQTLNVKNWIEECK